MLKTVFARFGSGNVHRHTRRSTLALLLFSALTLTVGAPAAQAAPKPKPTNTINLVPTIQSIGIQNGQLVATGFATATIKGVTTTVPFTAPVNISLAADQSGAAAAGCPILDLALGPIHLNLLGLVVDTSPICLTITAYQGGGLLGDLLCGVANALNGGLSLNQILASLTAIDLNNLLSGITSLLNGALQQLNQAILTAINVVNAGHTCAILHLDLGPLDLTLLGLNVHLDNCNNGPVTVDITAVSGPGALLGNLLCQLLDGGQINLGTTLGNLLQQILGLLNV